MDLFKEKYGEIAEINKETISYLQKHIVGLNRLLQSIEIPLKVTVELNCPEEKLSKGQRLFLKDYINLIHYFSHIESNSSQ